MHELLQVDVPLALKVHHCKQALTDDSGERSVLKSDYSECDGKHTVIRVILLMPLVFESDWETRSL